MELQKKIIDFIKKMKFDRLPETTRKHATRAIIDATGCLLAGIDTPVGTGATVSSVAFWKDIPRRT